MSIAWIATTRMAPANAVKAHFIEPFVKKTIAAINDKNQTTVRSLYMMSRSFMKSYRVTVNRPADFCIVPYNAKGEKPRLASEASRA